MIDDFPVWYEMVEWARHWLKTAPLMGDKTKELLTRFVQEWDNYNERKEF